MGRQEDLILKKQLETRIAELESQGGQQQPVAQPQVQTPGVNILANQATGTQAFTPAQGFQNTVQQLGESFASSLSGKGTTPIKSLEEKFESKGTDQFKQLQNLLSIEADAAATNNTPLRRGVRQMIDQITGTSPTQGQTQQPAQTPAVQPEQPAATPQASSGFIEPRLDEFGDPVPLTLEEESQNEALAAGIKARETEKQKLNLKREVLSKDITTFLALDQAIPRGEGIKRFGEGLKSFGQGVTQETTRGIAVSTHNAARKRLRVQLVRAAGDVGNLNIVEQKAAELMIPGIFDSEKAAELKRAFLQQVSKAIDTNDSNLVVETLNKFMESDLYDGPSNPRGTGSSLDTGKSSLDDELAQIESDLAAIDEEIKLGIN